MLDTLIYPHIIIFLVKSGNTEHVMSNRNREMLLDDTDVLSRNPFYYPRLYRESIETAKNPYNFNRQEESVRLNRMRLTVLKIASIKPHRTTRAPTGQSESRNLVERSHRYIFCSCQIAVPVSAADMH